MAVHPMQPSPPPTHERRLSERGRSARLIRDAVCLLSSKWSVDLLLALGDGTRRYHELLEDLEPIWSAMGWSLAASTPRCRPASSTR
jgi:hypothetical protein